MARKQRGGGFRCQADGSRGFAFCVCRQRCILQIYPRIKGSQSDFSLFFFLERS